MARKLIPYSRFSGTRQEAGDSQRRQDALAEQAAKEERVEIDWTLSLKDKGISAFRGANWKKGDLGKFLDLVDAGIVAKGSILCIEQVNRLSRLPWMEQVQLWKEILSRGIIIRTCVPPARYTAANMNELTVGCPVVLFMMLGHIESQQKSQWSFQAFDAIKARTRKEGRPHEFNCPTWIDRVTVPHPKDPARKVTIGYKPNEERIALIQWMHERAQAGWGAMRIQRALIEKGEPGWGPSGHWTLFTIRDLLTSRKVLGEYQPMRLDQEGKRVPDGLPISNHYPAAIDEECFQRTQAARRLRRRRGGRRGPHATNLFTHLVYDTRAAESVHCKFRVRLGKRYKYLTTMYQPWTFPYWDFERAVLTTLAKLKAKDVDGRHEADALSARVEALQQERARLALDLDALDQQLRELPAEKWPKRAVARMAELEAAIAAKDEELRTAKEAANTSTRTEALSDLKTCIQALDEARGKSEEQPLRHRIKGRVPFLVESIWVRMQAETQASRYVHVRMYLHGGEERYFVLRFGAPKGPPLPLADADFRGGEERGYAHKTCPPLKVARKLVAR